MPVPRSSFVGRTAELDAVRAVLNDHRLVTVTGMGGAGKTRLATELAAEAALAHPHGATFVELAPVRSLEGVVAALLAALRPPTRPTPAEDRLAPAVAALEGREMLLVIDNCEHVLADAARVIDRLLDSCPGVSVLATSREPLRLSGERTVGIGPLPIDPSTLERPSEAIQLFVDRATAVRDDFVLDEATIAGVTAVCRSVDGLPLAIELAAAHVSHLSPAEIARRLATHPGSLASRVRGTPDRHRTLVSTLDWSFELLSEAERSVFCALSVFAGGATLDAVVAVCCNGEADPADALGIMSGLVDKSLVVADPRGDTTAYRMTDAVRRYARARLEGSGGLEDTRRRHARWLRDRPARLSTTAVPVLDDVAAALSWAVEAEEIELAYELASATWRGWELTGRHAEGRELLERVRRLPRSDGSGARARVIAACASLAFSAGDYDAARRDYERAIVRFRELDLDVELSNALNSLSMVALFEDDLARARDLASEALERSLRADGPTAGGAFASSSLGMIEARAGHAEGSERHFLEALRLFRHLGLHREAASVLNNLGNLAADGGDAGRAHRFYEGALQLQRRTGDERGAALSLNNLCLAAQQRGNLDHAWEHAEAAGEIFRALEDRPGEAATLNNLANLAAERGHPQQAMDLYARSIEAFRAIGDARRLATALANLADLAIAIGERQLAWDALLDATSLWNQLGHADGIDAGLRTLGELASDWGMPGTFATIEREPTAVSHALESARWVAVPSTPSDGRPAADARLTPRETQVVSLVARGMTNAEIATELFISERTVESHVSNARMKLDLDSRTKLTRWAIERGMLV